MTDIVDLHRSWISWLMNRTGLAISPLATNAGMAASTLSRMHKPDFDGFGTKTINKVKAHYGVPGPEEWEMGFGEDDATPYTTEERDPIGDSILAQLNENADKWLVRNDNMVLEGLRRGDYIAVALGETPEDGDCVIAQIYDHELGTASTVLRLFRDPYLLSRGVQADPEGIIRHDDRWVTIKGVVRASWRLRQANFRDRNAA